MGAIKRSIGTVEGLDSGVTGTKSASMDAKGCKYFTFFIKKASGNLTALQLELECSPDGSTWYLCNDTIPLTPRDGNYSFTAGAMICDSIRLNIKTQSTVPSTIDVEVLAE